MHDVPYGYCHCGCGQKTTIIPRTAPSVGQVKGEPYRFLVGHHKRVPWRWTVEDRGYVTPCWIWGNGTTGAGYGVTQRPGLHALAHRAVYEVYRGAIPEGLHIDHLCRVPLCVNPDHLEPVTPAENVRRGMSPGAVAVREQKCKRGHDRYEHGHFRRDGTYKCCGACRRLIRKPRGKA